VRHTPVLLRESLEALAPTPGMSVCDVTLGLAGHASAFLQATDPDGILIGIDADERNLDAAAEKLQPYDGRVRYCHANFRDLSSCVDAPVDILFADLGVSSPHFDDPDRGFSFRFDAPLDLRFDQSRGVDAASWIARAKEQELTKAFAVYGELPSARRLAVMVSEQKPTTTTALKACVEAVYRWRAPSMLPRVFQAIRIAVNDELGALDALLHSIPHILKPGGRCGIISYHSLEDRMVKRAFRSLCMVEKDERTGQPLSAPLFAVVNTKPIIPGPSEVSENPRSRSAKLRVLRRAEA